MTKVVVEALPPLWDETGFKDGDMVYLVRWECPDKLAAFQAKFGDDWTAAWEPEVAQRTDSWLKTVEEAAEWANFRRANGAGYVSVERWALEIEIVDGWIELFDSTFDGVIEGAWE